MNRHIDTPGASACVSDEARLAPCSDRSDRWHSLAILVLVCLLVSMCGLASAPALAQKGKKPLAPTVPTATTPIKFTPFGETNDDGVPFNTSSVLPVSDGVFLLVDNRIDDAMLELHLD